MPRYEHPRSIYVAIEHQPIECVQVDAHTATIYSAYKANVDIGGIDIVHIFYNGQGSVLSRILASLTCFLASPRSDKERRQLVCFSEVRSSNSRGFLYPVTLTCE